MPGSDKHLNALNRGMNRVTGLRDVQMMIRAGPAL
jgi:hypothetical protein